MAFAKLASSPVVTQTPVTLLYVRERDDAISVLDARIAAIVGYYKPFVLLEQVAPDELVAHGYGHLACPTPAVFVLRKGDVVGQAIGAMLPHRELDSVVRCAVEWPDCQ